MQIDAYDILGVPVDCDQDEIRKAFKKMSLKEHPDKALANGRNEEQQNARYIIIKDAHELLEDEDRRKRYDTFGQDLGKDPPEMEVWNIGLATLLQPIGSFLLKTTLSRFALWFIAFRWISYILILCGIICIILYALDTKVPGLETSFRSPDNFAILVNVSIINIVVILGWISTLFADTVGILYLASEVVTLAIDDLKVGAIALVASFFFAWLLQGWWYWILGLEVILGIVLLIGVTVAAGIIRLWIDTVQASRGEKVKEYRKTMRSERKKLQDEIDDLKKKLGKPAGSK